MPITTNVVSSNLARARWTHITLCGKVCQWLVAGRWFSPCTLVSSTIKTDRHDITEILLKVALNTIIPTLLDRYTSTHLKISILSEILGAQYTKILDLSFTFDYPIICKTVKIYWPIQWTGHHSFVYGCKHSPFIQIFDLLALWASKSIIVLAQTQIYYLDQKEKTEILPPHIFEPRAVLQLLLLLYIVPRLHVLEIW